MEVALLQEKSRLVFTHRPVPECASGELLLRVKVCGVCRTDRKAFYMGQKDLHMPRVLGHETAGIVESVGPGVTRHKAGDRVVLHPGFFCGKCLYCRQGLDQLCPDMRIFGFHLDGGFQEFLSVPAEAVAAGIVLSIPPALAYDRAALAEPLACAINAGLCMQARPEDALLIIGAGALGILTAKLWRHWGVENITLVDVNPKKAEIAAGLGFKVVSEAERYTAAIACCPGNEAFALCVHSLQKKGRLGFFSGLTDHNPLSHSTLNAIHYNELIVTGSYGCSLAHTKQALNLLAAGLDIEDFLIYQTELQGINLAELEPSDKHFIQIVF